MTAPQYTEYILRQEWANSISGRPHNVGRLDDEIKVVYESDEEWRRMNLANYDYLVIKDGGISDMSAQSFGWSQESSVSRVTVDIRTKGWPERNRPGRIALYGEIGGGTLKAWESPRWGGLVGETLRCIKEYRKGPNCEYDLIDAYEADDLSGQMGGQVWRSVVNVRFDKRASTIDTSK